LADEARRRQCSLDRVLNEVVRRSLAQDGGAQQLVGADLPAYRTVPHQAKLRAGFDPTEFNRLVDEIEDDVRVQRL
jgi:hypothetical protein